MSEDPDREGTEDSDDGEGGAIIIAAILVGLSLLMASYGMSAAVDRTGLFMSGALGKFDTRLRGALMRAQPRPAGDLIPSLDPAKKYSLNTVGSPVRGPETAKLTLVEFADLQCPFCARATPTLRKIRKTYGDDVRIVFKHLPLPIHPKAPAAHLAAEAAHRQGKFWEMHDKIYRDQMAMGEEKYLEWAAEIGLDLAQFKQDLATPSVKEKIAADGREASDLGVNTTPLFFVNGYLIDGAKPFSDFKALIDRELAQ